MANPVKGEIVATLSDGRKFTLVADFEATIEAESLYDRPAAIMAAHAKEGRVGAIRAIFYGMLKRHHRDMTPALAAELLQDHGPELQEAMQKANGAAVPDPSPEDKKAGNGRNRSAGKRSGGSGAKRA